METTAKTRLVALLGWPVEHSFSPRMHNAAFDELGLDYHYMALPVRPEMLGDAVRGIRALNLAGTNVTVPHKENVMPFLDDVSPEGGFIGAVNTIVNRNGKLSGYNTDGRGFMRSLEEEDVIIDGGSVLIVGCGGASRAISYYLSEKASVYLFDIDTAKARRLAADLDACGRKITLLEEMGEPGGYGMVVNATPLGLKEGDPLPVDVSLLKEGQVVCDLIYKETAFLKAAASRGLKTMNGLGMLLWQGVYAFELWTGETAPHGVMRETLLDCLEGR